MILLVSLTGCGFQPQLRDNSTGQYDIAIPLIPDRDGQILRAALVQRLNQIEQPRAPTYGLALQLRVETKDVANLDLSTCQTTGQSTDRSDGLNCDWQEVLALAHFEIRTINAAQGAASGTAEDGRTLWQGIARGRSDQREAQLGWRAVPAAELAREQALTQLADDMATQVVLALYAAQSMQYR
ncbi:MAG: hypothetical protein CMF26_05130 [Kiloniella sp.]|nr:hypothetical protein [Kiloniella sp.]RZO32205.1 MAG: hypothetical protein EVA88_01245 [Rhodospirillaceae bacterium]